MSSIIRATTTSGLQIAPDNSGSLQLQTNGTTTAVTIDTSQRVGIGTASPTGKLQVSGAGGVSGSTNLVYVDVTSSYGGISLNSTANNNTFVELLEAGTKVGGFNADTTSNVTSLQSDGGHALAFNTGGSTERMRIDSSGNLLVGTTTNIGTNDKFEVSYNGSVRSLAVNSSGNVYLYSLGTGTVYSNGGVLTSTNPSDERLKDNITDLSFGLQQILALRPVSYNWKSDTIDQGAQYGFIAQEVQTVMPELVRKFETTDGEETVTRFGLEKEGIYAAMVKAIQEMKAIIDEQSVTINNLKARIETLEAK